MHKPLKDLWRVLTAQSLVWKFLDVPVTSLFEDVRLCVCVCVCLGAGI